MDDSEFGDVLIPRYRFEYDDRTMVVPDDLENFEPKFKDGLDYLAVLGEEDEECEVTLLGYES